MERSEAINRKLKRYKTGRPCIHGHVGYRSTKCSYCLECRKAKLVGRPPKKKKRKKRKVVTDRQIAIQDGRKIYFGKKCRKRGHGELRYTSNGTCVKCGYLISIKRSRKLRLVPEQIERNKAASRRYRTKNKMNINLTRKYYYRNRKMPYEAVCLPQTIESMPLRVVKLEPKG